MTKGWWRQGALVAVLSVAGGWAFLARSGDTAPDSATVHREDLVITVEASGELDAVRSSLIGPPLVPDKWDYKISFMAPESSVVRRGDPILAFDTASLETERDKKQTEQEVAAKDLERRTAELAVQVHDLEMQLTEAQSRERKAQLKAETPEELSAILDARLARLDLDLAHKEVASLRTRLENTRLAGEADLEALARKRDRAEGRVREIQESIAKMRMVAPQDGIVIYQADNQGEKKKVGDVAWATLKVMKIPDLSEMYGKAEIDEADAGRVIVGQPATVRLDALADAVYTGKVREIGRIVQEKSRGTAMKVYKIEVALDRTDTQRMRPGMRLNAQIEVDRVAGALVAPRDAVFLRAGGPVVFLGGAGGGWSERSVKLGRRNGRLVEILEGATEGDRLSLRDLSAKANGRSAGGTGA